MDFPHYEVEAYVKTSDTDAIVSLLSGIVGPLAMNSPMDADPKMYRCGKALLVLGESENAFVSVWLRGSTVWPTSPAFGRFLAAGLSCTVLCDPGREFPETGPQSSVFLRIENAVESLVTLG